MAELLGHHVLSRLSDPSFITSMTTSASHLNHRLNLLASYFPTLLHSHTRGKGLLLGLPFKNEHHPSVLEKMVRERGALLLMAAMDSGRFGQRFQCRAGGMGVGCCFVWAAF